jgi:hypothetical protein
MSEQNLDSDEDVILSKKEFCEKEKVEDEKSSVEEARDRSPKNGKISDGSSDEDRCSDSMKDEVQVFPLKSNESSSSEEERVKAKKIPRCPSPLKLGGMSTISSKFEPSKPKASPLKTYEKREKGSFEFKLKASPVASVSLKRKKPQEEVNDEIDDKVCFPPIVQISLTIMLPSQTTTKRDLLPRSIHRNPHRKSSFPLHFLQQTLRVS